MAEPIKPIEQWASILILLPFTSVCIHYPTPPLNNLYLRVFLFGQAYI